MEASALAPNDPAVEIRPGVFRPDWSVVATTRAREALAGRMAARAGLLERWAVRLDASEDLVWRTVLRLYAERGEPPKPAEIGAETGIDADAASSLLRALRSRDLVDLDPQTGRILLAYPFTQANTAHRVELKGHRLHALCAIDALGVAAMDGTDVNISSPCRHCGATIHVKTAEEGTSLHSVVPREAVVWNDFAYDGSAATSCCPATTFFCSGEHLRQWLHSQKAQRAGIDLTVGEALEVGRAIFGPVLSGN